MVSATRWRAVRGRGSRLAAPGSVSNVLLHTQPCLFKRAYPTPRHLAAAPAAPPTSRAALEEPVGRLENALLLGEVDLAVELQPGEDELRAHTPSAR